MADNKITDKSLKEKVLDNRLVRSIITVVAVMCVAFIILLVKINIDNKDARSSVVTEDFISGQLQELNELATSKVIYDGVVEMEDDSGIFKKKFYVKYTGEVKSYVDMSKADIKIDDRKRKISITLPHATVGEPELEDICNNELPLHIVEKKIPYMDENGDFIKPETPNGYKFETLILDMIHMLDTCLPFEVERRKEFAPIKNKTGVDSIESARELLKENGIEL